jgi:RNA polymerase sigma-70 factor (ECF subfamily)
MEDRTSFETAVEPLLRPLHAHCYRFVGGLGQADDLVQESLLRAWRKRDEIRDPQALPAWLFRIATNACLDELRRARPRLSPWTDDAEPGREWVEPYPDVLVDGMADPAGRYSLRESVNLAFVSALQLLSPRQRASLILRDVLDWRAAEVAALLEVSTAAVESALARARAVIDESPPAAPVPEELDDEAQAFLDRYLAAWEAADVDAIAVLLRDDVRYGMPPLGISMRGREAVRAGLAATAFAGEARYRMLLTRAGGRIAVAGYADTGDGWEAQALQVLELDGGRVADIVAYLDPGLVVRAGLPARLAPAAEPA